MGDRSAGYVARCCQSWEPELLQKVLPRLPRLKVAREVLGRSVGRSARRPPTQNIRFWWQEVLCGRATPVAMPMLS